MYQSIILNLLGKGRNEIDSIINSLKEEKTALLEDDGTFWIIVDNRLENGELEVNSFYVAEKFTEFKLKNIILVPDFNKNEKITVFANSTFEILFYSKKERYFFNKDPIREKHIWKDVEWGKRKKNYHPLGKDPGNVWLKTEDDGKANITEHILVSLEESVKRIIKSATKEQSKCLLIGFKKKLKILNKGVTIEYE